MGERGGKGGRGTPSKPIAFPCFKEVPLAAWIECTATGVLWSGVRLQERVFRTLVRQQERYKIGVSDTAEASAIFFSPCPLFIRRSPENLRFRPKIILDSPRCSLPLSVACAFRAILFFFGLPPLVMQAYDREKMIFVKLP